MKPILIQGAENSEINYFLEILKNKNEVEIGSFKFWTGEIFNLPIVVSRTKVGEINCAIATTIGILKFEPRCIINQGTAGSHSIDIHRGDIIVGEKYVNICNFQINYAEKGEYTNINRWNLKSYYSDDDKIISNNADLKLIEILKIIKNNIDEKIIFGTIGSGDIWNREVDRILYLHEKYGTLCEDMETAGAYNTANSFGIPIIGIRIISNNEITSEKYNPELSTDCQKFVEKVIKEIGKEIS